jgi:hypothetical protein
MSLFFNFDEDFDLQIWSRWGIFFILDGKVKWVQLNKCSIINTVQYSSIFRLIDPYWFKNRKVAHGKQKVEPTCSTVSSKLFSNSIFIINVPYQNPTSVKYVFLQKCFKDKGWKYQFWLDHSDQTSTRTNSNSFPWMRRFLLFAGDRPELNHKQKFVSDTTFFLGAKSTSIRDCVGRSVGWSVGPLVRPSVRPHDAITWKTSYVAIASRRGRGKLVTSRFLRT